jgi:hypothetical protein
VVAKDGFWTVGAVIGVVLSVATDVAVASSAYRANFLASKLLRAADDVSPNGGAPARVPRQTTPGPGGSKLDFNDPSVSPGNGWEWRGKGGPGSSDGSWYNPDTKESLHPDLDHPEPIGPHYDWKNSNKQNYRIYEYGRIEPKDGQ